LWLLCSRILEANRQLETNLLVFLDPSSELWLHIVPSSMKKNFAKLLHKPFRAAIFAWIMSGRTVMLRFCTTLIMDLAYILQF
jgi:hypothetical protein